MSELNTFKVTFAGGAQSPTGSNFLLEVAGKKILIDCGLYQGEKYTIEANKEPFSYNTKEIDCLFITHAHLDHVGKIPRLVADGFNGVIYSTAPTHDIAELVMLDSMGVLGKEAARDNVLPLYTERDVINAMRLWKDIAYHEKVHLFTEEGDVSIELYDAGHILGSSVVVIEHKGKRIAFSGDLGNTPSPLMRDTEFIEGLDYLCIESVYGDRNHEDYDERVSLLKRAILDTIHAGGTLMVPAFSVERTQELLFYFNEMVEHGEIPSVPVYLDSPLGINVTKVYKKYESWFNENIQNIEKNGDDIFAFKGLIMTPSPDESRAINMVQGPKVIIAGSGMSNGGRIVHHEERYLPDPKSTILIVGYQAVGTIGRHIVEKAKTVFLNRKEVEVRAKLVNIHGFSAHKDSDHLVAWAGASKDTLKKVFVILGETKSSLFLAQRIHEEYGVSVAVPKKGEVFFLS